MEFELKNEQGKFYQVNNVIWKQMLYLAKRGGWIAHGTIPPQSKPNDPVKANFKELLTINFSDWGFGYWSNAGQTVTTQDALSLAESLELMLNDLPDNTSLEINPLELEDDPVIEIDPVELLAGENKQKVVEVIHFCRQGEFIIT